MKQEPTERIEDDIELIEIPNNHHGDDACNDIVLFDVFFCDMDEKH